ncbi:MAG: hypothetical protein J6U73_05380 [Alistipes sp.]|nr:hypothetical protein [Alistipes sp.]
MIPEEQLNTLLSKTENVAREDQIFLREGVEMASQMENVRFSLMDDVQAAAEVAPYLEAYYDSPELFVKSTRAYKGSRINYSLIIPDMDAAYLSAVERGDMETAQRMVMEAAKLAMPNTKVVDEEGNPKVVCHWR